MEDIDKSYDNLDVERLFEKGRKLLKDKVPRDAVIRIGKIKFDVHKKFLLLWSPYFKALFSNNWSNNHIYDLDEKFHDSNLFKALVQYLYTGKISLRSNKCYSICVMADYFQLPDLIKLCEKTLVENVKSSEISDLMKMVDLSLRIDLKNLKKAAKDYFVKNGQTFLEKRDLSSYDFEDFSRILSEVLFYWDYPQMKEKCFDVIIDWIQHDFSNRKNFLEDLISEFICFKEFSLEFLNDKVSKTDLIQNSLKLNEEFLEAMKKEEEPKIEIAHNSKLYSVCRSYHLNEHRMNSINRNSIETQFLEVNSATGETIASDPIDSKHIFYCTTVYEKKIYVGVNGKIYIYDCENNTWQDSRIPLRKIGSEEHRFYGIVYLNGFIYIAGGYFWKFASKFYRYSIETKQWKNLKSMNEGGGEIALIALNNYIYALGGEKEAVERYNIETNVWEYVSKPSSDIHSHNIIVHNGLICVLYEDVLHVYNSLKDFWICFKKSFPKSLEFYALISYKNDLLAITHKSRENVCYSSGTRLLSIIFRFDFYSYEWQTVDNLKIFYSKGVENVRVVNF